MSCVAAKPGGRWGSSTLSLEAKLQFRYALAEVFFRTTDDRDAALTSTFDSFGQLPLLLDGQVARCL